MATRSALSRRAVMRTGMFAMGASVVAAALAACGETKVVEKVVTKEVPVEKIVTQTVEKVVTKEVPVEKIVTQTVEKVVTKEVEKVVEKTVVQTVEAQIQRAASKGINLRTTDVIGELGDWAPVKGGRLIWGTPGPITNFNPVTMDQWSYRSGFGMYESLFTWAPGNKIIPHLAQGYELSADRLVWTVRLRKDVKFHDGTPFNADAVKYNFDLFLDESKKRGEVAGKVRAIKTVEKVDDSTVKITTKQPAALFLQDLASMQITFASPAAYKKFGEDLARNPVGTGPWMFKEWKEQVSVLFTRFADYKWTPAFYKNQGPALPDEFEIKILAQDAVARAAAFEAGEVDGIQHFQFPDMERFATDPNRIVMGTLTPGMPWFLAINTLRWPTDDIVVRTALNHAINKKLVVQRGNGGIPRLAGNILVPGTIGFHEGMENKFDWNVAKANKLLDDKGYKVGSSGFRERDGKVMTVEFPNTPNPLSELYKLDIESSIKIKVEIPNLEFATYINEMAQGKYTHQWTAGPGPDGDVLWPKYQTSNYGLPGRAFAFYEYSGTPGKANPDSKVDKLLDGARTEFDEAKRVALWRQAQEILMNAVVAIPLADQMQQWFYNVKTVGGRAFAGIHEFAYTYDLYSKRGK
ncbi:MAG: hypothetical protein FJ029_06425 [Actinobacteria bacterium]|nr:hypothetical protein [Actinomycetota bacterium]